MTTKLTFGCACRQVTGSFVVPNSVLPLPLIFCHCETCRRASGQLFTSNLIISKDSSFQVNGTLAENKTSENLTRYFCHNCGSSIYYYDHPTGDNDVCSGILDRSEGLIAPKEHIFVDDTKDGGASPWIDVASWATWSNESDRLGPPIKSAFSTSNAEDASITLDCHCQCRGVEFKITRPDRTSSKVSSPLPDLLVPFHSQLFQNPHDFKWWLCKGGTRYLAGTCGCNSCRLSTGYDLQSWAFVPKSNILQMDGSPINFAMGTLKRYSHTKGAERDFCQRCGATVFWHCDARPGIIDISAGLLDSKNGALAEDWVEWTTERVSFEECASNKSLISSFSEGLRKWGARKV